MKKLITNKQLRDQNPIRIPSLKTVQNEYGRSLEEKEGYRKVRWGSNQGMINRFRLVRKYLSGINYETLLDIGCGTGDLFKVISENNKKYFAYDLNFGMVLRAQENINSNVHYFVASGDPIPLKAESVDVVTLIGVLQNCGVSVEKVIKEVQRVVKPGGYVFLITKNLAWERFLSGELKPEKEHNWFFDEDINIPLRKYGFEIIEKGGFINQSGRVTYMEKSHEIFYWIRKIDYSERPIYQSIRPSDVPVKIPSDAVLDKKITNSNLNMSQFDHFDYKGYLQNYGFDIASLKKHSMENLAEDSVVIDVSGQAMAVLSRAKWDEKILKTKAYVIQDVFIKKNSSKDTELIDALITKIINYVKEKRIGFLTFRFSAEKYKYLQLFERRGFTVADILCTYLYSCLPAAQQLKQSFSELIRPAVAKDSQAILKLSHFEFSRIVTDQNIPKKMADQFYARLAKSFLAPGENLKLVAEHQGKVCGFAIGAPEPEVNRFSSQRLGYLWLISVSEKLKGHHYGKKLLNDFLLRFSKQVDYVEVSTQLHNLPARRLYTSFGLSPATYIITLHYWNKDAE